MSQEISKEELKEFIKDLNKLARKHKMIIGGCGCCDSPFVTKYKKIDGRYVIQADGGRLCWEKTEGVENE